MSFPWAMRMGSPPLMNDEKCRQVIDNLAKHTGMSQEERSVLSTEKKNQTFELQTNILTKPIQPDYYQ